MAAAKIPEKFWKWAFITGVFVFYFASMVSTATNKGIYSQTGAALLGGILVFYLIFSKG